MSETGKNKLFYQSIIVKFLHINFHSSPLTLSHSPPRPCHRNHGRSPPQQHTPHLNPSSSIVDAFTLAGDVAVQLDLAIIVATAIELELQAMSPLVLSTKTMADRCRTTTHHPQNPPSSIGDVYPCQGCRGDCQFRHNRRHSHRIGVASWVHLPNFAPDIELRGWKE